MDSYIIKLYNSHVMRSGVFWVGYIHIMFSNMLQLEREEREREKNQSCNLFCNFHSS